MSLYILIKEDSNNPSEIKANADKFYFGILDEIKKSGIPDNKDFITKLKTNANMAYLEFEGIVDGDFKQFTGISHSRVHIYDKNNWHDPRFHQLLLQYFHTELTPNYFVDGYVNSANDTMHYINSNKKKIDEEHWKRNVDAESRLLENLIGYCNNREINGVINIYTQFEPCLSCSSKLTEFLKKNLNVTMNIYYSRKYGKR